MGKILKGKELLKKKALFTQYYECHPEEALEDRSRAIKEKNDDFIFEKIRKWKESCNNDNGR